MTGRPEQPIGDILDGLGIVATVEPGTLVASAIVILKTVLPDGQTRLSVAYSDGLGWIERAGMLHVAASVDLADTTDRRTPGA